MPDQPILVPVDFSEHSEAALLFAAATADCTGAPLLVLHVVHDPGEAPGFYARKTTAEELQTMEDVASDMMEEFMARIRRENPGCEPLESAQTRLLVGLPVTRILQFADSVRAHQIVMGSRGRTGLLHILLGSKAEQVVRLSPYPVTIVKTPGDLD